MGLSITFTRIYLERFGSGVREAIKETETWSTGILNKRRRDGDTDKSYQARIEALDEQRTALASMIDRWEKRPVGEAAQRCYFTVSISTQLGEHTIEREFDRGTYKSWSDVLPLLDFIISSGDVEDLVNAAAREHDALEQKCSRMILNKERERG